MIALVRRPIPGKAWAAAMVIAGGLGSEYILNLSLQDHLISATLILIVAAAISGLIQTVFSRK